MQATGGNIRYLIRTDGITVDFFFSGRTSVVASKPAGDGLRLSSSYPVKAS